jgi:hypothetical protein
MSASGTPIFKTAAANATGVTVDLGQQVAGVALRNDGPDTVFWAVGGTPPSPTKGDGRCSLDVNKTINLAGLSVSELSFICATAETATIQIAAVPQGEAILEEVAAAAGASGFYHPQTLSGAATATSGALAVAVNGATRVICTNATLRVSKLAGFPSAAGGDGTLSIYGTFDGGVGRKLLAAMVVEFRNPGSGDNYLQGATFTLLVDITGATTLTEIDAEVTGLLPVGVTPTISGSVKIMGVA